MIENRILTQKDMMVGNNKKGIELPYSYSGGKQAERIKIALPSGELEKDVTRFLREIGLEIPDVGKKYLLPITNSPIDLVVVRASDVPSLVQNERSHLKAGITGSDILWEAGYGKDAGIEIPVGDFFPKPTTPSLFIGITESFGKRIRQMFDHEPTALDLTNKIVVTKFPNIAQEVLNERKVQEVEIFPSPGKTESWQYVFDDCVGIIDVIDSGSTTTANDIEVLEKFYEVSIKMIEASDKLSRRERDIIEDFKERIAVARERRRMV